MYLRRAVSIGAAFLLCACASQPVGQVRMVSKAFDDLNAASQPLLDEVAIAERRQGQTAAIANATDRTQGKSNGALSPRKTDASCEAVTKMESVHEGGPNVLRGFCIDDSYYYTDLTDPPATRAFRRSLAAVGDYTRVLVVLAEGQNVEQARGELQTLAANVGAALAVVGVSGAGAALNGALGALQPLLDLAAKDANAVELERLVREEAPKVERLIEALRQSAPELFITLTEQSFARLSKEGLTSAEVEKTEAAAIEYYRVAVSSFVVLLDQYQSLLKELVASYDRRRNPVTLASLAERSADLSARAEAWRKTLAAIRMRTR
jgi:hypothetical protein